MKLLVLFALFAVAVADVVQYYKTGNDNLNIATLIADVPRLKRFMDCFNDKGPCTPLTHSYKVNIREAVQQTCKRCNTAQKHIFGEFLVGIKRVLPQDYMAFRHKYDPENKYFDALEAELAKY